MANPIYNEMMQNNPQTQFAGFMQNPFKFLMERQNINIPADVQSNPQSAVNYLIQSGVMNQGALNSVVGKLQKMGFKF